MSFGMSLLGTPYVAASSSKNGFDCLGFCLLCFNHIKIQMPRSYPEFKNFGTEMPIDSVKKGDVLLFLCLTKKVIGHIVIFTNPKGMGNYFIHSCADREIKVIVTGLKKPGYTRRFVKAIRIL